jgi:hypothetical protein
MSNLEASEHVHCLDLLRISSPAGAANRFSDCAILLEIWGLGGLLQTNIAIPENTEISIPSIGSGIPAKVVSCQQDDFGFMIEILVNSPGWFPEGYLPPQMLQ